MSHSGEFPVDRVLIRTPGELTSLLRAIRRSVDAGQLQQLARPQAVFPSPMVLDLHDEGPWPDIIEMHFRDGDGKTYRLIVETYRGLGGEWTPIDDAANS